MSEQKCECCGAGFEPVKLAGKPAGFGPKQRYCGKGCRVKATNERAKAKRNGLKAAGTAPAKVKARATAERREQVNGPVGPEVWG